MHKIATSVTAIGVSLCLVSAAAAARVGGGFAGHAGGGGVAHFSGMHAGSGGMVHFGGAPHVGMAHMGVAHIGSAHLGAMHLGHTAHIGGMPGVSAHLGAAHALRFAHFGRGSVHGLSTTHGVAGATIAHGVGPALGRAAGVGFAPGVHGSFAGAFAAHRHFFASGAFRPFFYAGWHPYHHLGWIGPLFWPYAYGDFFYYSLWPADYAYFDPFWVYGYGDIYTGIFWPYSYEQYVRGPHAPARMAALTQQMTQSCSEEADEVTGWPINEIQDAVKPDEKQNALLDAFGNAVVQASDTIKSHCPTSVSFTPTGRLDAMQQRLQALTQAVDIVTPPLTAFYDSLSDEQKARFNEIGTTQTRGAPPDEQASEAPSQQAACGAAVMAWPAEQIERTVRPTEAQRGTLEALQSAAANAADTIKASCPSEIPSTPPARLAAVGKRLQAMLQGVEAVRPALADFYNALSDDQKARFNTLGRQLFAASHA